MMTSLLSSFHDGNLFPRSWLRILKDVHKTPDDLLHTMKEEMNPRNAVASIDLIELER